MQTILRKGTSYIRVSDLMADACTLLVVANKSLRPINPVLQIATDARIATLAQRTCKLLYFQCILLRVSPQMTYMRS